MHGSATLSFCCAYLSGICPAIHHNHYYYYDNSHGTSTCIQPSHACKTYTLWLAYYVHVYIHVLVSTCISTANTMIHTCKHGTYGKHVDMHVTCMYMYVCLKVVCIHVGTCARTPQALARRQHTYTRNTQAALCHS